MKCNIEWLGPEGVMFESTTASGHKVRIEGPPEAGGQNRAPRPMELILTGAGACMSYDIVHILKKGRQAISGCRIGIDTIRAETEPKVFTKIHLNILLKGKHLNLNSATRAVDLSLEKYCSGMAMLGKTAKITYDLRLEEDS